MAKESFGFSHALILLRENWNEAGQQSTLLLHQASTTFCSDSSWERIERHHFAVQKKVGLQVATRICTVCTRTSIITNILSRPLGCLNFYCLDLFSLCRSSRRTKQHQLIQLVDHIFEVSLKSFRSVRAFSTQSSLTRCLLHKDSTTNIYMLRPDCCAEHFTTSGGFHSSKVPANQSGHFISLCHLEEPDVCFSVGSKSQTSLAKDISSQSYSG